MALETLPPLVERPLRHIASRGNLDEEFSIVTYNILADCWLNKDILAGRYEYVGDEANWKKEGRHSYRHKLLMSEVKNLDATILCLQELETDYERVLKDELVAMGYSGVFELKFNLPEGLGIFFKKSQFELLHHEAAFFKDMFLETWKESSDLAPPSEGSTRPEIILMAALKHKNSGQLLVIGCVHIGFIWRTPITQALQVALAAQALGQFASSCGSPHAALPPHVLCGDFNIEPHFPAYHIPCKGHLSETERERLGGYDYITWPDGAQAPCKFPGDELALLEQLPASFTSPLATLRSAYHVMLGREPPVTNHEGPGNAVTLDYIWFSSDTMNVTAVLETVGESAITPYVGLPNKAFPSDHLSLKAYFQFKESTVIRKGQQQQQATS